MSRGGHIFFGVISQKVAILKQMWKNVPNIGMIIEKKWEVICYETPSTKDIAKAK